MPTTKPIGCQLALLTLIVSGLATTVNADDVTVGGRAGPNTPGDFYWQKFTEHVAAAGQDRIKVRLLVRGEVGPEVTLFAQLRRGRRVQMGGIAVTTVSQIIPELDLLRLPFLFDSLEEVGYVMDEHLKAPLTAMLLEHDLVFFDWQSAGWLNFYAQTPIRHPDDVVGQRMRINASPAAVLFMKAVDADIVPISFDEIVTALQTGLIDGGEQSTQLFLTGGMAKFAPHYTRTQHAFLTAIVIANKTWFDGLSEADREIYRQAVPHDSWYRDYFSALNVGLLEHASADGLTIHNLSSGDRNAWRERTSTVAAQLIEAMGPRAQAFYDIILAGKAAYAEQQAATQLPPAMEPQP